MSDELLFKEISEDFESKIGNGVFVEGDKLPSERKLSLDYDVSRNVIRQSLTILSEKGLIEIKPGKGAYVTAYNEEKLTDSLKMIVQKYNCTIEDILEVREELELSIITKAVNRRTSENIEKLISICKEMESTVNLNDFLELDLEFHKTLADATQNKIFKTLVYSFYDITEQFPFLLTKYTSNFLDIVDKAQLEHRELIEALRLKDMDRAVRIMKAHMKSFREEVEVFKNRKLK